MKLILTPVATAILALAMSVSASAATFSSTPDGSMCCWGNDVANEESPTYGQTFIAPSGTGNLLTWTFFNKYEFEDAAKFVISLWDGTNPGAEVFSTSSDSAVSDGTWWAHTYTVDLPLIASATYIAYVTITGVIDPPGVRYSAGGQSDLGGGFFLNNDGLANGSWESDPTFPQHMQYSANFGAEVPLPPAVLLFISGLGALGVLGRRRSRKSNDAPVSSS